MRKKKRRLSVFIMVILILTVGMAGIRTAEGYAAWQQDSAGIAQGIATEIIRFHVRANSDSEAEPAVKASGERPCRYIYGAVVKGITGY